MKIITQEESNVGRHNKLKTFNHEPAGKTGMVKVEVFQPISSNASVSYILMLTTTFKCEPAGKYSNGKGGGVPTHLLL
jgi:hypothetical protein